MSKSCKLPLNFVPIFLMRHVKYILGSNFKILWVVILLLVAVMSKMKIKTINCIIVAYWKITVNSFECVDNYNECELLLPLFPLQLITTSSYFICNKTAFFTPQVNKTGCGNQSWITWIFLWLYLRKWKGYNYGTFHNFINSYLVFYVIWYPFCPYKNI